jgi:DNA invertase Pin-like site-specific DNA recombinase
MAAWEREIIGERTAVALEHKAAQGERTNYQAPFGCHFEDGKVVKDDVGQGIIRKVEELREDGYSIRAIVALLKEQGHTNRNGKAIGRKEVWRITKKAA